LVAFVAAARIGYRILPFWARGSETLHHFRRQRILLHRLLGTKGGNWPQERSGWGERKQGTFSSLLLKQTEAQRASSGRLEAGQTFRVYSSARQKEQMKGRLKQGNEA
jgi:hypothetical protein